MRVARHPTHQRTDPKKHKHNTLTQAHHTTHNTTLRHKYKASEGWCEVSDYISGENPNYDGRADMVLDKPLCVDVWRLI